MSAFSFQPIHSFTHVALGTVVETQKVGGCKPRGAHLAEKDKPHGSYTVSIREAERWKQISCYEWN